MGTESLDDSITALWNILSLEEKKEVLTKALERSALAKRDENKERTCFIEEFCEAI